MRRWSLTLVLVLVGLARPCLGQGSARYRIRGWVTGLRPGEVAQVKAEGPRTYTQATEPGGQWEILFAIPGSYRIWVEHQDYAFQPSNRRVRVVSTNVTGINFVAKPRHAPAIRSTGKARFRMKGTVTGLRGGERVVVRAEGKRTYKTRTRKAGRWALPKMLPGNYRVSPVSKHHVFRPPYRDVLLSDGHLVGIAFEARPKGKAYPPAQENRRRVAMSGQVDGLQAEHRATIIAQGPITYRAVTDRRGRWRIPEMEPGKYSVSIQIEHESGDYSGDKTTRQVLLNDDKTGIVFKVFYRESLSP